MVLIQVPYHIPPAIRRNTVFTLQIRILILNLFWSQCIQHIINWIAFISSEDSVKCLMKKYNGHQIVQERDIIFGETHAMFTLSISLFIIGDNHLLNVGKYFLLNYSHEMHHYWNMNWNKFRIQNYFLYRNHAIKNWINKTRFDTSTYINDARLHTSRIRDESKFYFRITIWPFCRIFLPHIPKKNTNNLGKLNYKPNIEKFWSTKIRELSEFVV